MTTTRKDLPAQSAINRRLAPTVPKDAAPSASQIVALDLATASTGKRLSTLVVPPVYVAPTTPGNRAVKFEDILIEAEQISSVAFRTRDGLTFQLSDLPIGNGSFSYVHLVKKSDSVIDQIYALKEIAIGTPGSFIKNHRLFEEIEDPTQRPQKYTSTYEQVCNEVETAHALRAPSAPHFAIRVKKDEYGRNNERIFLASPVIDQTVTNVIEAVHQFKEEIEQVNVGRPENQFVRSRVNYALGVHLLFDGINELERYHRERSLLDIKPDNILIDLSPIGKNSFGDFGLAQSNELAIAANGTPDYMAPELLFAREENAALAEALGYAPKSPVDGTKADIFSFGRTLTEALVNTMPFYYDADPYGLGRLGVSKPSAGGAAAYLKEWMQHSDDLARWARSGTPLSAVPRSKSDDVNDFVALITGQSESMARVLFMMTATSPELRPAAKNIVKLATRMHSLLTKRDASGRFTNQAELDYRAVLRRLHTLADDELTRSDDLVDANLRARAARRLQSTIAPDKLAAFARMVAYESPVPKTALEGILRKYALHNSMSSMRRSDWLLPYERIAQSLSVIAEEEEPKAAALSEHAQEYVDIVFNDEFKKSPALPADMAARLEAAKIS